MAWKTISSSGDIAEALAKTREFAQKKKGMDLAELCRRAKITPNGWRNLESIKSNPRLETLIKIAESLGFDLKIAMVPKAAALGERRVEDMDWGA